MDIPNPEETQRVWLTGLDEEDKKVNAYLRDAFKNANAQGRPVAPEEIVAVLNALHAADQYLSSYVPTANALAELNHPRLSERLAQVRQDIHQSIDIYSDMYRNAVSYRTQWEQIQRDTHARVNQMMAQSTAYANALNFQNNQLWLLVHQGVPYAEALALSRNQPYPP